ncbi:NADPH:quinone reductase-like Zn-dependent oxidoreductase [Murinocardiopsis flavida]|uniref:NADPH:quinone reductase-like Zn-dependent oxidoreductase n=1 Tax=Murinocardiopsis flavida TaxID=645275 RepID=A0A2P8DMQ9_9ACTN|nr:NADP-dependent oxidoreductase [Murinocardiopsis flavida]PSK98489.1 NADPH:quinone reductase-like Zn-dependent oxidoreductase [Murinocardiopsis flavida]
MQASAFTEAGPPDVLALIDVPTPVPGPGEVLVRVRTAGVQPVDAAVRSGWGPPGVTVALPQIPGNEFAGTVESTGDGVTGFRPGDDVIGFRVLGCYAEYAVLPAAHLVRRPASLPWDQAGALSASGQTAHTALGDLGVRSGETVLIHGAAGGVGSIAVQLAVEWGATVIGTAAPANHAYLRTLGAVPVAYGDGLLERVCAEAPKGIDAAFDTAGHGGVETSRHLVKERGRIGTIADTDAGRHGARFLRSQRTAARLAELTALAERGRLRVHIRSRYPLERAADAHREIETGHGRGKIVLVMG